MKNQSKKIYKYIEENVNIEFEACELKHLDQNYESKFRNSFYSLFSVIKKGRVESIFKFKNENIRVERNELTACYIPREVYAKTMLLHSSEADILWSRMNFNIFGSLDLLSFFDAPLVFDLESSKKINSINQELYNLELERSSESIRSIVKRKKLCFDMLELVLGVSSLKKNGIKKLTGIDEFLPVIDYINNNYKQKITNDALARLTHLSLSRFCHKFKSFMGVSPYQYTQQLRFFKISKHLANTNLRISEIAYEHGFSDQFHFSRAFKAMTGYSPLQYRKLSQNAKGALFSN
jgi:AraC-like DNA-binding protein